MLPVELCDGLVRSRLVGLPSAIGTAGSDSGWPSETYGRSIWPIYLRNHCVTWINLASDQSGVLGTSIPARKRCHLPVDAKLEAAAGAGAGRRISSPVLES